MNGLARLPLVDGGCADVEAARQDGDAFSAARQLGTNRRGGAGLLVKGDRHGSRTPGGLVLNCSINSRMTERAMNSG